MDQVKVRSRMATTEAERYSVNGDLAGYGLS